MRTLSRTLMVLAAATMAVASHAAVIFSDIIAVAHFTDINGNSITQNLTVVTDSATGKIDFFANPTSFAVGGGTGMNNLHIDISYVALSDLPVDSIQMVMTGNNLFGSGVLSWTEFVETHGGPSTETLADYGESYLGLGLGGANAFGFNIDKTIDFSESAFNYKVKKSIDLILLTNSPETSFVSIGFVEQNHNGNPVPEPATMGALAMGAIGVLARRRRK